jgi:hypothetical protein
MQNDFAGVQLLTSSCAYPEISVIADRQAKTGCLVLYNQSLY